MNFCQFEKDPRIYLKQLQKKLTETQPYTRDPWMMRFNTTEDKYEEFLRKEGENF